MEILIGADPEFFVSVDGKATPAAGLIPGTKENPHRVKDGAVQVDGCALEFNISPAKSVEEFLNNIQSVKSEIERMVTGHELMTGRVVAFLYQPVIRFPDDIFKRAPVEAKRLGCDPDFNAWSGEPNVIPAGMEERPLRTASGHIHIGWTQGANIYSGEHFQMCQELVRQLDFALYVPSKSWRDKNYERQQYYGATGCFRPKPYGVEYRVLSNTWVKDPELTKWVFNQTIWAVKELQAGKKFFDHREHLPNVLEYREFYDRHGGCPLPEKYA